MKRKSWLTFLLLTVGLVAFSALSCTPTDPTQPGDVIVTQTVTVGTGGSTQPGGASPGTCNPVASVGVSLLGTGGVRTADIRIGQSIPLDTTPKDANNQIRPDACNAATPVLWRLNPTSGPCSIDNETSYTPTLTGRAVGRCEAFSTISGITATVPVVVNVRQ